MRRDFILLLHQWEESVTAPPDLAVSILEYASEQDRVTMADMIRL
jgi:hypothetical protein